MGMDEEGHFSIHNLGSNCHIFKCPFEPKPFPMSLLHFPRPLSLIYRDDVRVSDSASTDRLIFDTLEAQTALLNGPHIMSIQFKSNLKFLLS